MTSFSNNLRIASVSTNSRALKPLSTFAKALLILGGMIASPLISQDMAIAQEITYPNYSGKAQFSGGNCLPVRSQPDPNAFMVYCVPNGESLLTVVREVDGWVQLADGNWTWEKSINFSRFPIIGASVQTRAGCSNVRKAPSTAAHLVGSCLPNGTVLNPIIDEQDGWYGFESGNWIWGENVFIP